MIHIAKGQRRGALLLMLCVAVSMTLAAAGPAHAARAGRTTTPTLAPGAGLDGHDRTAVVQLQLRLRRLGYGPGPIDGLYGRLTASAVRRLQAANKVVVDGIAGQVTQRVLNAQSTVRPSMVRRAQRRLHSLGHHPGKVDGLLGPRTVAALHEFRAQRPATRMVRVLARLDEAAPRKAAPGSRPPATSGDSATDAPGTAGKAAPRPSAPTAAPTTTDKPTPRAPAPTAAPTTTDKPTPRAPAAPTTTDKPTPRAPAPTAAPTVAHDAAPRDAAPDPTPAAAGTPAPSASAEATPTRQPGTLTPAPSAGGSSPAATRTPAQADSGDGGGVTSESPTGSPLPRPPASSTPLPAATAAPADTVIPVSAPAQESKPPLAGTLSTPAALLILAVAVLAFLFGRDTGRPGRGEPRPERGEPPAVARVPVHDARGRRPGTGPSGARRRGAGRHDS